MRLLAPAAILVAVFVALASADDERPVAPKVGATAPDFRLNDHEGRATSLAEAREGHWVVLAFFPRAATPG